MRVLNHYRCPVCEHLWSKQGRAWAPAYCPVAGRSLGEPPVRPDTYDFIAYMEKN